MSTTHLFTINGDMLDRIERDPRLFVQYLAASVRCCRQETGLSFYGADYVTHSMDGFRGVIENASREYL